MSIVYSGSNPDGGKFEVRRTDNNEDFVIFMTLPSGEKVERWASVWQNDKDNLSKVGAILAAYNLIDKGALDNV